MLSSPVLWIEHSDLQEAVGSLDPLEMILQTGSFCERIWSSASLGHFANMNRSGYDVPQVLKTDSLRSLCDFGFGVARWAGGPITCERLWAERTPVSPQKDLSMHCRGFVRQTSTHPLARLIQVRQERLPLRQPKNKYDCLKDKSNMQEQASTCSKQTGLLFRGTGFGQPTNDESVASSS